MLLQLRYQAVVERQSCSIVNHMLSLHARHLERYHLLQIHHVILDLLVLFLLLFKLFLVLNEVSYKLSMLLVQQLADVLCLLFYKLAGFLE